MNYHVAAFYRFLPLEDLTSLQAQIIARCLEQEVIGILLIAPEGINSTIAAPTLQQLEKMLDRLDDLFGIRQSDIKYSTASFKPFRKLRVRIKKEIITMKAPAADPHQQVGTYVTPDQWNQLINDPDVLVLDTRNSYETGLGIFKGAVDPKINVFSEFPEFVKQQLDPEKHKKIAMFCTGGIRCEKASSYMLAQGFEQVYHLRGGILKYLEEVPPEQSLWDGTCFVFDRRVALDHGLTEDLAAQKLVAESANYSLN